VEILHKLVFARPGHDEARNLQADAYEQLGYQVEDPQWRGIFLTAARELRDGVQPAAFATARPDSILAMPIDILFDFVAVHLDGAKAADADLRIDVTFTDHDETWTMWVRNGVLNARRGGSGRADLAVSGPKAALVGVLLRPAAAGAADVRRLLDEFDPDFAIVTP
jgi:alkyl sulfatase BDS1-like metallo-beta-lactamase superfamily hydrolase